MQIGFSPILGRRKRDDAKGPHSWAAFGADDVEDARRGAPARDLRDYARERGLVFDDRALCGAVLGVMPRWEAYVANARGGVLAGRAGVVLHELLELRVTTTENSTSLAMGGTFADKKLRGDRITSAVVRRRRGLVAWRGAGRAVSRAHRRGTGDHRGAARPRGGAAGAVHGPLGYRLLGADDLPADLQQRLFAGPAGAVLRDLGDDAYVELDHEQGSLALRRNGFITEPAALDLQAAALFPLAPGADPTPPGGLFHEPSDMLVATCDDLVACWKRTMDKQELSVTGTSERGWAAATALGLAAG